MTPPDSLATQVDRSLAVTDAVSTATSGDGHDAPAPSDRSRMAKYFAIFRVSLAERMTYRGDFLLGTILRFLPMVTTILLWQAIYAGLRKPTLGSAQITTNASSTMGASIGTAINGKNTKKMALYRKKNADKPAISISRSQSLMRTRGR